jgi:RNA-directed DNA polymerase
MTEIFETESKTVPITKEMVKAAYRKVKSNAGSAGVDKESLEDFQANLLSNLYKIWNRLSSGSYFPQPVREATIPKSNGKRRTLGIPTVSDRIAQQVIKSYIEPRLEKEFHTNSYGYRPLKSAHDAVRAVRENVKQYSWVLDLDIKSYFDEVNHELLMKALEVHVEEKWVKMYIKRWLEVPSQRADGVLLPKSGKGTPQGGVISPLLANLYLHYVLDKWLDKNFRNIAFVRYADDIIIHCNSEEEVEQLQQAVRERLSECRLSLNEEKTKIVYCQNYRREKKDFNKRFDFLGFTFKPCSKASKYGGMFLGFDCTMSPNARRRILEGWKKMKINNHRQVTIQEIAEKINPQMIGIFQYYGKIEKWSLQKLVWYFHFRLAKWVLRRYKRFKGSIRKALNWIKRINKFYPNLFYHWTVFKMY